MEAFINLTKEEFPGAIERMGATIQGLRQRVKNLIDSLIGLEILKPALDLLGQTFSGLFDKIAGSDRIQFMAFRIGGQLSDLVEDLLESLPPAEEIVQRIGDAMFNVAEALKLFREGDIFGALAQLGVPEGFLNFIKTIQEFQPIEKLTGFIDNVRTAFQTLKDWWMENKEPIIEALRISIGDISGALGLGGGGEGPSQDELNKFQPGGTFEEKPWWEKLAEIDPEIIVSKIYIIRDAILAVIEKFQWIQDNWQAIVTVLGFIGLAFLALRYPLLTFAGMAFAVFNSLPIILGIALVNMVKSIAQFIPTFRESGKNLFRAVWQGIVDIWNQIVSWVNKKISQLKSALGPLGERFKGVGKVPSVSMPAEAGIKSTSFSTTNYNINVNANYAQTQAPVGISDDLSVLLGSLY